MRRWWEFDRNWVPRPNKAAGDYNRHDARFADELPFGCSCEHRRHKTVFKLIELYAGIAQASDSDNRSFTNVQFRTSRKFQ